MILFIWNLCKCLFFGFCYFVVMWIGGLEIIGLCVVFCENEGFYLRSVCIMVCFVRGIF